MTHEELEKEVQAIKQTLGSFEFNQMAKNAELEKDSKQALFEAKNLYEIYLALDKRVQTLEEARKVQIELNKKYSRFVDGMEATAKEINKPIIQLMDVKPFEKKGWWKW